MKKIVVVAAVLVIVIGGAGFWYVQSRDTSDPVDFTPTGDDENTSSQPIDPNGNWVVQPSETEGKDLLEENAAGSWAGYRVKEELRAVDVTAVGRTNQVSGQLTYADGKVTAGNIDVDMTTLKSDQDKRDNAIKNQGIETDEFPAATFVLTQPLELSLDSKPFEAEAVGDLTLHGVTKEVTLTVQGKPLGDAIEVIGQTDIVMADYDIEPISLAFVTTSDEGVLEFKLRLEKG